MLAYSSGVRYICFYEHTFAPVVLPSTYFVIPSMYFVPASTYFVLVNTYFMLPIIPIVFAVRT